MPLYGLNHVRCLCARSLGLRFELISYENLNNRYNRPDLQSSSRVHDHHVRTKISLLFVGSAIEPVTAERVSSKGDFRHGV